MALGEMNSGNKTLPEWSEVQNKPSEFNPATHIMTFTLKEIIEMITLLRLIIMALMVTITVG